ncbi:MAG: pilus assembly FimT family protein, partial [Minisyncoccia bacterium]
MGSLRRSSGFTLIEMMVSLAIVTIIAGVVLTSHSSFSNSLIVSNTAYDVALSMREAQSYGIGVRGLGSTVNVGYGLDFSAATPLSYRFFSDGYGGATCGASAPPNCKPGDGVYSANHDAVVSNYT